MKKFGLKAAVVAAVLAWTWTSGATLIEHEIAPAVTGSGIAMARGPHMALVPPVAAAHPRLLITLGGTNSFPRDLLPLGQVAADLGFHVIGVDYPNSVISTICRGKFEGCFERFRQEIVLGDSVSEQTSVDHANCLRHRIQQLLRHLVRTYPSEGWQSFVSLHGEVKWDRVVVAGHSQGSGHAAYLAKRFALNGVVLLAGPQDVDERGAAAWLQAAGATSASRYTALLHRGDVFGVDFQIAAVQALRLGASRAVTPLRDGAALDGDILVSNSGGGDPHMMVTTAVFAPVWRYLLQRFEPLP
ncbi:MAG: hypothetical protein KF799_15520 [Bdellovibrionales bacterium]|nr:hypothetical protein [Bdellovibrionales bacterium]